MSGTFTVPHPNLERTKIIVLGDQSTGKTSLITRFMYDTFDEKYQATIGIDFLSKTMYLDDPVRLQLWDTAGQERFRSLIPSYIRDSSVVITVYDITNRASFMSIGKWIDEVRSERPSNVMIVLVGNKADHSDKREVTVEEAIKLAGSLDIIFMETSAKTGHNVNTLFQKIAFSPMDMEKDGANVDRANSSRDNPHKESMEDALRRAGWLRGFRVDGVFEPRISAHQVASYMNGAEPLIEEGMDTLSTEIYISKNEREANYFQRGWPLEATTGISPWTSSRITANNQPNGSGTWYTKMTKAKRVKVEALLQDLVPAPEFLKAIEKALTEPTVFEKFQAVYLTLSRWGDVVPLEIEIGSSITLTSNHVDCVQPSEIDERNFSNIAQFLKIKDASVAITGAGPSITYDQRSAIQDLASNPQWKRISVNKVVPIINLLPCDLQTRLSELYAQRLCCVPPDGVGPVNQHCKTYDDYKHASRTISSIKTRCSYVIELLSITYADGVISNNHGGGGHVGAEYEFTLDTNEHITEMLIWIEGTWLYGLQFITSMGRCSDQYGIHRGTPTVARCKGGVLVGFISHTKLHPDFKELFHQVQGIWRRDLVPKVPKEDDVYSDYFGNIKQDGKNFNDRVIVGNSTSMRISSIEVWSSEQIDSVKFTYTDIIDGQERTSTTNRRGGPGGLYHKFMLENGEHVVTVSGRHEEAHITQLCFVTNRGRTSEVFGGGNGQSFSVLSPRDKSGNCFRLQYVCGKSTDKLLASIMFVWTPC